MGPGGQAPIEAPNGGGRNEAAWNIVVWVAPQKCCRFSSLRTFTVPVWQIVVDFMRFVLRIQYGLVECASLPGWTYSCIGEVDFGGDVPILLSWCCLQCFDAVGWAAGRASGL